MKARGLCTTLPRALLALALLLAPLGTWWAAPATAMPVCAAEGGVRLVPDPFAPPPPAGHCDACLIATPALPVPPPALVPMATGLSWAALPPGHPAPLALPPERARGPPAA
ncbi:hypothetical protein GCM10011504_32480 [Siccirubricoccus deserti]|uniref:DUF2946 domain-containing protein n=1 Tax=Siccirubricoccus deserti TaxID=2013562 RepID=A0A9X0R1K3_9PROT|nr:hypothetical protein [Siccirubricoccus deserti]MBC4016758.1 hypothetical protein [Siccirubricoccus deserti]GGC51550.1 hypothetical protein GCM10011504_32480 [Siccirubricoccus deserti]